MKFITLTYTDNTRVYLNLDHIIAIDRAENNFTQIHLSGSRDYILVKEIPEQILIQLEQ